jgi:hypothetical protein
MIVDTAPDERMASKRSSKSTIIRTAARSSGAVEPVPWLAEDKPVRLELDAAFVLVAGLVNQAEGDTVVLLAEQADLDVTGLWAPDLHDPRGVRYDFAVIPSALCMSPAALRDSALIRAAIAGWRRGFSRQRLRAGPML